MVLRNPLLKLIIPRFFTYTNGTIYPVGGNNGTTYPTGRANGKNILLVKLMVHNLLNNYEMKAMKNVRSANVLT